MTSRTTGVTCARCGCADLRTRNTIRRPNGTLWRYRVCRHCGRVTKTIELPAGRAPRLDA